MIETMETRLNRIYESFGYRKFKMSKFESYDLYAQNRDFLKSGKIITFTDLNGTLLALKPDITLSIIKNNSGDEEKVYYNENVYRAQGDTYKEIMQAGVECVGRIDTLAVAEVLLLALKSLEAVSKSFRLNLSDAAFVGLLLNTMQPDLDTRKEILSCIASKNTAGIRLLAAQKRITEGNANALSELIELHLPLREGIEKIRSISPNKEGDRVLEELGRLCEVLEAGGMKEQVYLDFSLVNSMDYYDDVIFQGFIEGIPFSVLSGGRYDRLPEKMGKELGAVGFAVYLDRIAAYLTEDRKYDGDCLLIYGENDSFKEVMELANQMRQREKSVRCIRKDQLAEMKRVPRFRETIQFTGKGGEAHD